MKNADDPGQAASRLALISIGVDASKPAVSVLGLQAHCFKQLGLRGPVLGGTGTWMVAYPNSLTFWFGFLLTMVNLYQSVTKLLDAVVFMAVCSDVLRDGSCLQGFPWLAWF